MAILSFIDTLRDFDEFNLTIEGDRDGITYFENQFWTSAQRAGNAIHEVSYRACFKPQLPSFFISRLSMPGESVYDPFMGRGTTLIEAGLMGRKPVGNDINPLAAMLCRPRLSPPLLDHVAKRLDEIEWNTSEMIREDLLVFYHPTTLQKLCSLRRWLLEREASGLLDNVDDWIRMVAINRLTGHSKGFFSVYTLPPNQAVSIESQRRINTKHHQTPPERDVKAIILHKTKSLLKHTPSISIPPLFTNAPAWNTPAIADETISLVVTSPPFLDIVNYAADNWLRSWFAGIDASTVTISMHRDPQAWEVMVRNTLVELARVLRPGGHVAFEVGEVRKSTVLLERLVWSAAESLPFDRLGVMINTGAFTKTAQIWKVGNNAHGTNTNRIVVLRRK